MEKFNYQKICQQILKPLNPAQKEVLERRFGLVSAGRETLESIGKDFGVTRERIRQIEKEAFLKLQRQKEERMAKLVFFSFETYFRKAGGLKREDIALSDLGGKDFPNNISFLLTFGDPFFKFKEAEEYYTFWSVNKEIISKIPSLLEHLYQQFKKIGHPISEEEFEKEQKIASPQIIPSLVEVSKKIEIGPSGVLGLVNWPEIKPKGVKDKAYLVLKQEGKPLYFKKINESINSMFSNLKPVLTQTVHNELIRDERFILVGRGIYALKEWGYEPGEVKDVIIKILKESKNPLSKEEIVKSVLAQRLVKENTILLNLNNKEYFLKLPDGKYIFKQSI
ncbi:hypothetical protein COS93_00585 [bacterium (Candidatus Gribaldobacteria) CG07_land_8_20_14_0_80_33_18]|uniref:HTH HARE-type domain-containing protein n=1 Tax=bacterium (Candidatus Gribaldobacteria) CG07_land_8_20_14_0_80_33_18 TaxID=2014272 RepID=A0A2M6Z472_9BACT|nr:MAG: hypothetical protein COS93_00585 [bacterium (Candidatus Gribaldobacteria) CG07_land_8_20_14_0_80_33_18]PJA00840.1 MAG: hypothetical protein COX75_01520 [bacterium (Candidatus Gribaldobacteria) CG_4_10_14_0_2_um_filter_33_15]PJB09053.1 MAG: hypothetical protein CO122_00165 [bacterium (Candidatus Gribaldobacteria) CG_4_9_14_3_um_filter_33_9]